MKTTHHYMKADRRNPRDPRATAGLSPYLSPPRSACVPLLCFVVLTDGAANLVERVLGGQALVNLARLGLLSAAQQASLRTLLEKLN
jgi:hypothetical protein